LPEDVVDTPSPVICATVDESTVSTKVVLVVVVVVAVTSSVPGPVVVVVVVVISDTSRHQEPSRNTDEIPSGRVHTSQP